MSTHDVLVERRRHDLPPLWDDQSVTWGGWEPELPTTLVLHLPIHHFACDQCGSLGAPMRNVGIVEAPGGATALYRTRRLFASRCPDCAHDTVYDLETDESWDIEPSDYLDAGSLDPTREQGELF